VLSRHGHANPLRRSSLPSILQSIKFREPRRSGRKRRPVPEPLAVESTSPWRIVRGPPDRFVEPPGAGRSRQPVYCSFALLPINHGRFKGRFELSCVGRFKDLNRYGQAEVRESFRLIEVARTVRIDDTLAG
jgi:hypothetical protein